MKNIIITGAGRGIGYALVKHFIKEGHQVFAISRASKALQSIKSEKLVYLKGDITNGDFRQLIAEKVGSVDVLIHNAGLLINKSMDQMQENDLIQSNNVNVIAPYLLTQSLLPLLSVKAHVLFISSVGGVTGTQKFPGLSAYSSSKAAMACLAECFQAEFQEKEWAFNALALGAVQTEMLNEAFPGYKAEVSPIEMAGFIYRFAINEGQMIKGKTTLVSRSNP